MNVDNVDVEEMSDQEIEEEKRRLGVARKDSGGDGE